jgi:hypothetical protein
MKKREYQRKRIALEIWTTEVTFEKGLRTLDEQWVAQVKA